MNKVYLIPRYPLMLSQQSCCSARNTLSDLLSADMMAGRHVAACRSIPAVSSTSSSCPSTAAARNHHTCCTQPCTVSPADCMGQVVQHPSIFYLFRPGSRVIV
ncbi:hypothetical protein XENORESO_015007 [Xenotaenia resolanae]|uniref:Uncharacterized protein n=1 Tax=Xenotaenia resolanae TaxID=208358 RepID=A0ABV0WRP1_9TELE